MPAKGASKGLQPAGKRQKVPVAEAAVLARIRRQLSKTGEAIRRTRPKDVHNLGEFHVINVSGCYVSGYVKDLEAYARELGVLAEFEELEEEG